MEYFSIIKDSDIFENPLSEPREYIPRPTVKGIVLDGGGRIALIRGRSHSLFPGGGIEKGESSQEALIRECKEEIGCDVKIVSYIGTALNFRAKDAKKYEVEFFVANVVGEKGEPITTQEDEQGLPVDWFSQDEVLSVFEKQLLPIDMSLYIPHFNRRTHLAAFKEYLKLQK